SRARLPKLDMLAGAHSADSSRAHELASHQLDPISRRTKAFACSSASVSFILGVGRSLTRVVGRPFLPMIGHRPSMGKMSGQPLPCTNDHDSEFANGLRMDFTWVETGNPGHREWA
ncbi:MAG: hypothetical protein ACLPXB_02120, partial [Thiobacillaceae bacterium]